MLCEGGKNLSNIVEGKLNRDISKEKRMFQGIRGLLNLLARYLTDTYPTGPCVTEESGQQLGPAH